MNNAVSYDVIIVGGGFAGLTAAHWLGRFHRRTLVLTSGPSRNARSHAVHGYPGYEGADPSKLLDTMRREALAVDTELRQERVRAATGTAGDFTVTTAISSYRAKCLLIATGVRDEKPEIPDFDSYDGVSAWHCPACDGHEYSGKTIAVVGWGPQIDGYALELAYYGHTAVYTHGHAEKVTAKQRGRLQRAGIAVDDRMVTRLRGKDGLIEALDFGSSDEAPCDAVFYSIGHKPQCYLLESLGCEISSEGVVIDRKQQTTVPGIYAAGDIAPLEELVVVAAAMGAVAASNIHQDLLDARLA